MKNKINKAELNFLINAVMFLCMASMAGIGFLIKYTLIDGQSRWIKYGKNVDLYFLGMDRHAWGDIHLVLGFVLIGLLVLHIFLHWCVIKTVYNRLVQRKTAQLALTALLVLLTAVFLALPFFITPKVVDIRPGEGRHPTGNAHHRHTAIDSLTLPEEKVHEQRPSNRDHDHADPSLGLKGYMTLAEVSAKYKIPAEFIKTSLRIPNSVSDNQTFGRLRKQYPFTMHDVEKIIDGYRKKNKQATDTNN